MSISFLFQFSLIGKKRSCEGNIICLHSAIYFLCKVNEDTYVIILNSYHLKNDGSHRLRFYGGICKSAMSRSFLTIFHKNFCANPKNGLFSSSQG